MVDDRTARQVSGDMSSRTPALVFWGSAAPLLRRCRSRSRATSSIRACSGFSTRSRRRRLGADTIVPSVRGQTGIHHIVLLTVVYVMARSRSVLPVGPRARCRSGGASYSPEAWRRSVADRPRPFKVISRSSAYASGLGRARVSRPKPRPLSPSRMIVALVPFLARPLAAAGSRTPAGRLVPVYLAVHSASGDPRSSWYRDGSQRRDLAPPWDACSAVQASSNDHARTPRRILTGPPRRPQADGRDMGAAAPRPAGPSYPAGRATTRP